jgi:hypothetical protein
MVFMKLSDFVALTIPEKKHSLVHLGVLVGKRSCPQHLVLLFRLDAYYVEAWCHRASKAIEEYRVLSNDDALDPYLDGINLRGLLN